MVEVFSLFALLPREEVVETALIRLGRVEGRVVVIFLVHHVRGGRVVGMDDVRLFKWRYWFVVHHHCCVIGGEVRVSLGVEEAADCVVMDLSF